MRLLSFFGPRVFSILHMSARAMSESAPIIGSHKAIQIGLTGIFLFLYTY